MAVINEKNAIFKNAFFESLNHATNSPYLI